VVLREKRSGPAHRASIPALCSLPPPPPPPHTHTHTLPSQASGPRSFRFIVMNRIPPKLAVSYFVKKISIIIINIFFPLNGLFETEVVHLYLSDRVQMSIKYHYDPFVSNNGYSGPQIKLGARTNINTHGAQPPLFLILQTPLPARSCIEHFFNNAGPK